MNQEERKEIRRALSGRLEPAEDGRLRVLPADDHRILGISDGADAARLFGVMCRSHCYETRSGRGTVTQLAKKSMQRIGRGLLLSEQPETPACLIRYLLTPPVLVTFRYEGDVPTLSVWAGRSLLGWISLRRAIRSFEKQLPEELRQSGKKPPKQKKEKKEPKEKKQKEPKGKKRKQPKQAQTEQNTESEKSEQRNETEGSADI